MLISSAEVPSDERRPAHLVIEHLAAGYGTAPIVSDVSLTVAQGEVVTVIGPNGAGKSTLLKAIIGRLSPMAGRVRLGDRDITHLSANRLARLGVGYVPQVHDVFDTLTVEDNLEMGGYLLPKLRMKARLDEVLAVFPGIAAMRTRVASKLSGGERKMLAVARVLMLEPSLLILDEPTSNLSPGMSRVVLRDQVRTLADAGTAVLLVEQKALEALEVSDWGYVLVAGAVRMSGQAAELLARPDIREVFLGRVDTGGDGSAAPLLIPPTPRSGH
jgi:ABC-type branched-subunit amino acid transport system ATPase component